MGPDVTIVGYGAQGRAQALNARDSGWRVTVALRPESPRIADARAEGLTVCTDWAAAARTAHRIVLLIPDVAQPVLWNSALAPHLPQGACVIFAHGYNIHYRTLQLRADLDIVLAAPLASGETLRGNYCASQPTPIATAVHQDATGTASATAREYASALSRPATQLIATTFAEETETDLFSEQVLSCGGLARMIHTAFETLIAAGYNRELVYYTCLHEMKDLAALFARHGLAGGFARISSTARYGALTRGPRVIGDTVRAAMEQALAEIRDGRFTKELAEEAKQGFAHTEALLKKLQSHLIETLHRNLSLRGA